MAAISWKTAQSGDWGTASNWSGSAVPGASDAVTIAAVGSYMVTIGQSEAAQSIALKAAGATVAMSGKDVVLTIGTSFSVTAGTLSLTGNATVIDQPHITGGTLSTGTAGILLVNAVAGDTGGDEFDVNSVVSLAGTTTIASGADLALSGGGVLSGAIGGGGELDLDNALYSAKAASFAASLGEITIEGGGSLALGGASGTIAAYTLLANTGTIAIGAGTAITSSQYLQVGIGALLDYQYNSVLTGPGTLVTSGGGEVLDAGTGTDMLLLGGGINWTNTSKFTDYAQIAMNTVSADNVTITNSATGTFILEGGDANLLTHGSFTDGKDTFVNAGLLQRLPNPTDGSGFGTISFAAALNNTGTIDVESGSLALTDGGTLAGTLSGAGTLLLYSGAYTIGALTGGGHLSVGTGATVTYTTSNISTAYTLDNNEELAIAAGKTLTLAGPFTIGDSSGGGTISGPGTLVTSGTTTITDLSGMQALALTGGLIWTNASTGTVTDNGAIAFTGASFTNKGIFNFGSDSGIITDSGNTNSFINTGTFGKTAGSGSNLVTDIVTSTGTINVATGAVVLAQGGALSGTLSGAGALHLSNGAFTTTGLAGTGKLVIDNLVGTGYGTLTASATSTITASVGIDGQGVLASAAKATILTLAGPLSIDTVESTPSPDGGYFSGVGTIATTGQTTVGNTVNGGSANALSLNGGVTWSNAATGSVSDAGAIVSGGGTISNAGTFDLTTDSASIAATGAGDVFNNTGTLAKTGGTGLSLVTDVVNSSGTINVATGALVLGQGGVVTGVLSGAGTLHLSNGAFTTAGISGSGHIEIDNLVGSGYGTLTANANCSLMGSVGIDGQGVLGAVSNRILVLAGPLAIDTVESTPSPDGGYLSGAGTVTTNGATTIGNLQNGGSSNALSLNGGITWNNANSGKVTDTGAIVSSGGTIANAGTFAFAADTASISASGSGDVFKNTGTLAKTGGTGTSLVTDVVTSTGTINVASGALVLGQGGSVTGVLAGGGALHLSNGVFTTAGLSGAGHLVIDNLVGSGYGTLTATVSSTIAASVGINGQGVLGAAKAINVTLTGPLSIDTVESTPSPDGGYLSGLGTVTTNGLTTIGNTVNGGSSNALSLNGGITWANATTGSVSDSGAIVSEGGSITNAGTFAFAADTASITASGSGDVFKNTGTLAKTGGTGTSLVTDVVTSTGTINVVSGALELGQGGAVSGLLSGAGALHLSSGVFTTSGISGSGHLVIDNLVGSGYGTLNASATSTITASVGLDGQGVLGATAKATTLTLTGPVSIDTVESTPSPDGGYFSGLGTIAITGVTTIGNMVNGGSANALTMSGGITWSNASSGSVSDTGTIVSTGGTILNAGHFTLAGNGAAITSSGSADVFKNSGTLSLTGATGPVTIADALVNTGLVDAASGTLILSGAISGTGALHIDAGATLDVTALSNFQSVSFTGGGGATLKLEAPASAALAGFTSGDRLDFANTGVNTASISGTTLTVVTASTTYTYVSAGLAGFAAGIATDGAGGNFVTIDRFATATHSPEPLAFGNLHVGNSTSNTLALTVSNTALSDGYSEKLNAGLGGATAGFSASGTVTGIAAGASNGSSLTATIDTSTAGTKTGTATLALASNGAGIDGRGTTTLASQTVHLTGAVYNYAAAGLASTGISLGNQHVGSTPSAFLTLTNTAASGVYSEALDAKFTAATGSATGAGTATLIAAGASNGTALSVGLSPVASGVATGTETLTFVSDGQGTSGLGTTTLGTQAVSISGTFYNLAAGKLGATTLAFGNHHVGDNVAAKAISLTNSAPTGAFSEKLNAKITMASPGLAYSGTITGLAAGAANASTLQVTDTAASAGSIAGSVVLGLVSDGTGIDGLGTTSLLGQTITVTGGNYALASGTLASSTLNLGIIHAATAVSAALSLGNGAPTGGFGESLDAGLSGASAGLSTAGSITRLLAGATDSSTLKLTVNTAATGAYTGTAVLGLVSDGAGTSGLGTTTLGTQTVNVTATVDNYALAALEDPSGPALSGSSTSLTLNLGSTLQGKAALTATIGVLNAATALADQLGGTLSSAGAAGFTNSGLGTFALLSAGQDEHAQTVSLATGTAGTFSETITLSSYGTNASGYLGALAAETLTIIGTITPSIFHTYTLALGPNAITGADGLGDIFIASAGALNTRDTLAGGSGANSLVLSGPGVFDINAPSTFTNIPKITAFEGQAASGTLADTSQVVLMRDSATETLTVTAGTAATGNANPEAITIYAYTGTDSLVLAGGADQVFLGTGAANVKLGGTANSVTAGGGIGLIASTAAFASAAVVGTSTGSTTLEITTGGAVTLNAADTYLTVKLDAAGSLKLSPLSFITAIGSTGADTLTAMAGTQTLTGGLGKDILAGFTGGNTTFADTAAGLNGDTVQNWTTGDLLDLKNIVAANLHPLSYTANTLTVTDGTNSASITFSAAQSLTNFTVTGSDGTGGTLIAFHA